MLTPLFALAAALAAPAAAPAPALPTTGGTVAIEPRSADGEYDPVLRGYADAVAAAFAAKGYTILDDPNHAAWVADVVLARVEVGTGLARVPGQRRAAVGAGIAVPLSTGKSDVVPLQRMQLDIQLHARGSKAVAWHGGAVTVRAGPQAVATAPILARAALASYPVQASQPVGVP